MDTTLPVAVEASFTEDHLFYVFGVLFLFIVCVLKAKNDRPLVPLSFPQLGCSEMSSKVQFCEVSLLSLKLSSSSM
jgi:hypothetical protein